MLSLRLVPNKAEKEEEQEYVAKKIPRMTNETSSSQEPTRTACLHAMFDAAAGYGLKTCSTPTTKNPASPIEDANQSWLAPDAHLLLLKLPTKKV